MDNEPIFRDYKGKPIIELNHDTMYPFSFGLTKAKLFIEKLDDIRAFVRECESNQVKEGQVRVLQLENIELTFYKSNVILENISVIKSFIAKHE